MERSNYENLSESKRTLNLIHNVLNNLPEGIPVPTGVHYPLLAQEIEDFENSPYRNPEMKEELLDYLFDVSLEEGVEESSFSCFSSIKYVLNLQEVRLKLLSGDLDPTEASMEVTKIQKLLTEYKIEDDLSRINEFWQNFGRRSTS